MNKLMYRFVATTKKKKRNRPVLRHGMPPRGIPRKKKRKEHDAKGSYYHKWQGHVSHQVADNFILNSYSAVMAELKPVGLFLLICWFSQGKGRRFFSYYLSRM